MTYQVIDRKTGDMIREFSSLRAARRYADRLDAEYGGYRYVVRPKQGAEYVSQE